MRSHGRDRDLFLWVVGKVPEEARRLQSQVSGLQPKGERQSWGVPPAAGEARRGTGGCGQSQRRVNSPGRARVAVRIRGWGWASATGTPGDLGPAGGPFRKVLGAGEPGPGPRVASGSPNRSRAPRAAEDERAGVAAEDQESSESPRQCELHSEDLGSASPIVHAEKDKSPSVPARSAAVTASSCQLEGEEKEAHDYFLAFLNVTDREEAAKLRFLASIRTLCRAWLRGRYLPDFRSARELVEKMEALWQKELPRSVYAAVMWQQAMIAIAAMSGTGEGGDAAVYPFPTSYGYHPGDCQSQRLRPPSRTWKPQHPTSTFFSRSEEREGLLDQHLRPCLCSIFHLVPAQKMDSQHALLDAQILKTLDGVLEVLMHGASPRSNIQTLEKILQPSLPGAGPPGGSCPPGEGTCSHCGRSAWEGAEVAGGPGSGYLPDCSRSPTVGSGPRGREAAGSRSGPSSCLGEALAAHCVNPARHLAEPPLREPPSFPKADRQLFPSQVLLPFTASEEVARRQRAVGRIVSLSQHVTPSSMMEASPLGEGNAFLFNEKPLQFLGRVMGHLTLSCAETDQEISCGAVEALRAFHRFILVRQSRQAAREDPKLRVERESASTLWPKEPADDSTVDEVVWTIHTQLTRVSQKPLQDILRRTLLQLAHLYPQEVTTGLLQASPHCDSTARAMWSTLASEPCLADDVLKTLLLLQRKNARRHSFKGECICCSLLAVASAMREIFLVPSSRCCVQLLLTELFVAVVFQISFSLNGPQQGCCCSRSQRSEAKHPLVCPLRTSVSTMQALFRCLGGAVLVEDIMRQGAWDMLMSPETYHTGIAVLTRVLRHEEPDCCTSLSEQAIIGLLERQPYQDIGAMTVFVELLDCTDFEYVDGRVLHVLQSHLQSHSSVLRRMAVTSLVALSGRPEMAATLQGLMPEVTQRLQDDDCDTRTAALTFLSNMLCLADRQRAVPIALQLVKTLLPLFENESSHVRERSIILCRGAMEVAVSTHKEQMREDVQRSLIPLFFHLHDKDHNVAQASREALLGAAKFLKRRQLRKLLETEQICRVGECLLVEDSSRAEDYLHQSLPYLQSPLEPLREAAVRFIALQGKADDSSLSVSSLALQTLLILDTPVKEPPSGFCLQALCYRLRRAWRRRTPCSRDGWLCCRSRVRS
ncbi:uncharacterized protein M6G45_017575 [Spheniscus humboldti]